MDRDLSPEVEVEAAFGESTAETRVAEVPLAHVSVELGHLYMEDFAAGTEGLREHFARVAPWVDTVRRIYTERLGGRRVRLSTCFLIDDYFTQFSSPASVVPQVLDAASQAGLGIDYLARESGCSVADDVAVAELVQARIVPEPVPGTNGSRPPAHDSGWLSNGQREPLPETYEAMGPTRWQPPVQNSARRHSIFVDVELWDEREGRRTWSCPFLSSVWQLLRLGLLRYEGRPLATPLTADEPGFPAEWEKLPAILRLNGEAAPFSAYRTLSVLPSRFLSIEHAVRTILSQVHIDDVLLQQVHRRSDSERLTVPKELVDRIAYVFVGDV